MEEQMEEQLEEQTHAQMEEQLPSGPVGQLVDGSHGTWQVP